MNYEILNCYELDVRQDIPTEMNLLKSSNKDLEKRNGHLTIILFSIGLGVVLFAIYHSSKSRKEPHEEL
ncbi:hypothetical protein [uncultured Winogradskyella sp.]|jgi:hypothetical protein|uniref:hypothetical protein n=1 Tax=uncultured Winogradskyella sp. TaxID=395353 RepID=UPI002609209A|nr:hypothetical protein [uncultured Winogradskyella sp.]